MRKQLDVSEQNVPEKSYGSSKAKSCSMLKGVIANSSQPTHLGRGYTHLGRGYTHQQNTC